MMLKNQAKLPRDGELADAVRSVGRNTEKIFSNSNEFMLHHHDADMAARFRR